MHLLSVHNEWKYLVVLVESDTHFSCSAKKSSCAFHRSSNSILSVLSGPSEVVQMKLMYNTCVPIVTNTCEVTTYYGKEMESLHVAVNDAIRQIFSRVLCDSMNHYVGPLVGQSVGLLVGPSVGVI